MKVGQRAAVATLRKLQRFRDKVAEMPGEGGSEQEPEHQLGCPGHLLPQHGGEKHAVEDGAHEKAAPDAARYRSSSRRSQSLTRIIHEPRRDAPAGWPLAPTRNVRVWPQAAARHC